MDWATIMLQKEVADRLTARPNTKQYGIPTVLLKSCATVQSLLTLKPKEFHPRPKIDSVVVRIEFKEPVLATGEEYDWSLFQTIVRAAFSQRRKTLLNTLSAGNFFTKQCDGDKKRGKELTKDVINQAGIKESLRAEVLDLEQFIDLTRAFLTKTFNLTGVLMQNFVFHNPTKILFGKNTVPAIGNETALFGKKVLLVYGTGSIKKTGLYDRVIESLQKAELTVIEHPGVQSNPVLSHVHEGIALAKEHSCQVVCAVGGGSVLDEAKAICAGSTVEHDVWKFFTGKKSVKQPLPLTTVLTLAASGSEMNSGMVITNEKTSQKFGFANKHLHPKTSILDPTLTFSVPPDYTAFGAVDAIAHVLEFLFHH